MPIYNIVQCINSDENYEWDEEVVLGTHVILEERVLPYLRKIRVVPKTRKLKIDIVADCDKDNPDRPPYLAVYDVKTNRVLCLLYQVTEG